jgi:hypothetical protein
MYPWLQFTFKREALWLLALMLVPLLVGLLFAIVIPLFAR